ncbi:hypothetical protein Tco_0370883 [Tanacetum coccineum]
MYVPPPSITIVRPWFATIGYSGEIGAKGTLKKSCLPPRWRLLMGQIIQCLEDIIHKVNKKTREKVIHYSRFISLLLEYMMLAYDNKELTINPTQVFNVYNWALKPNQHEGPPFTDHMKAICNIDVHVDSQAPKTSSQAEKVPQGKKPRSKSRLRRKHSSKHTSESHTEASKSKTGQSEKETQSSSAKDKSPSHPSPPTLVVGEMLKEGQQAAGGPTSLGATRYDASADSTAEADPGLSAPNESIPSQQDLLKDTRSDFFTPNSLQDEPIIVSDESEEEETKKDEDTHATSYNIPEYTSVPHPPSPKSAQIQELMAQDHLLQSQKEKLEQQKAKAEEEELPTEFLDLPSQISLVQKKLKTLDFLPTLLNKVTETLNRFATMVENASGATTKDVPSAGQATASPTEGEKNTNPATTDMLKRRKSSKITSCDVLTQKGPISLKVHREDGTIPTKLETFTSTISSLSSHVAELKNIKWELPIEFLNLPNQVLRRLGSIFTSVYAAVQKLKKESWKELQFSLVDNSKLNIVYLLNRS